MNFCPNPNAKKVKNPLQTLPCPLEIRHSPQTTRVRLTLGADLILRLSAPMGYPKHRCLEFVHAQHEWITLHLERLTKAKENLEKILSAHEGEILLAGKWISLASLRKPYPKSLRILFQERLKDRLAFWSNQMGLYPERFSLRKTKNRLGSCSSSGALSFSLQLLFVPLEVLDYVIVHELAHLKHPNHSKAFWSLVRSHLPSFHESKIYLRQHHALHLRLQERI